MSTAHDLPDPAIAGVVPLRPALGLVAVPDSSPTPEHAFDAALAKAAPRLRRYAARRLGDTHEAEEIVQEALLRACQHSAGFATEDDLMAWTTVVTSRLVIDRLRVRSRSVSVAEVPDNVRCGRDTADVVVARDEARAALDALESMPARQAGVLWAREVEGLSYDEIASRFQLSEPTVRSLLHRARRTLRREYAARGGTLPVAGIVVMFAPWREGLIGLSRLREVAKQTFAPATAGAAALSVVGAAAVFVGPLDPDRTRQAPAVYTTPSAIAASATPVAVKERLARKPAVRSPSDVPTKPVGTAAATPLASEGTNLTHEIASRVPSACAKTAKTRATSGEAGINCSYDDTTTVLLVGRELPKNPTGLKQIGLTSNKVDCHRLPTTPITKCVEQDEGGAIRPPDPAPERS